MICASRLAELLDRVDSGLTARQRKLLAAVGLPESIKALDSEELLAAMQRDKKVVDGRLRFVLPTRLGHVELVEQVPTESVRRVWREAGAG